MALDPSIILSGKQFNPVESYSNAMTLSELAGRQRAQQMQAQQAQKQIQDDAAIAQLYQTRVGQDGKVDRQGLLSDLAAKGFGNRIPGMQKQFADADKSEADVAHTRAQTSEINLKALKQKTDALNGAFASLLSNPRVTHDDVISQVRGLVSQGWLTPEEGAQTVRDLPGPESLRQYLMQHGLQSLEASKRLDALLPKVELENLGDRTQAIDKNPLTNPGIAGQSFRRSASPDAQLSAATTRRGQDMQRELAGQGYSTQVDAQGNLIALPNKAAPGQPITAAPVVGIDGKPVASQQKGAGSATEDERKAAGWVNQARFAYKNMMDVIAADPKAAEKPLQEALLPEGTVQNLTISESRQRFKQAASSFAEAALRAATGAGVNIQEAQQKIDELTPRYGDKPAVVKQKQEALGMYLDSLESRAGRAMSGVTQADPRKPAATSDGRPPLDSFKKR